MSPELQVNGPYDPLSDNLQRADLRETWQAEATHNMFRVDGRPVTNDTIIVYVLGPTASGKSDLALQMAERLEGGAIIALDTRTLYKGMDIGTASPPFEDEFRAPHYLVDVVPYGIGSPVRRDVLERGVRKSIAHAVENVRLPIVTGGSVYLAETLLYGNRLGQGIGGKEYETIQGLTIAELVTYCEDTGIGLPFEPDDRQRLIHHILLRHKMHRENLALKTGTLVLGVDRSTGLEERIRSRTRTMMEQGLEQEVLRLLRKTSGFETPLLRGTIGYREFKEYIWGQRSLEEVEEAIVASTIRFANWQQCEFRDKIPHIRWVKSVDEAMDAFEAHMRKVWLGRNIAKLAIGRTRPAAERWLRKLGFEDLIPTATDPVSATLAVAQ